MRAGLPQHSKYSSGLIKARKLGKITLIQYDPESAEVWIKSCILIHSYIL